MHHPPTNTAARSIFASVLAAAALLAFAGARAADIYRWVDDAGRTQISDQVPDKYRAVAKRLGDSHQYELTPEQLKEAQARGAREKQQATEEAAAEADAQASGATAAASDSRRAATRDRKAAPAGASDCQALRAAYEASRECYSRFLNANGSIKPGAYETCGPGVGEPSQKCGIPPLPR
jgi:hypothetical protein